MLHGPGRILSAPGLVAIRWSIPICIGSPSGVGLSSEMVVSDCSSKKLGKEEPADLDFIKEFESELAKFSCRGGK